MNNLSALSLLPQEQLNLACSNEISELKRYRWLALIFLPFDTSVSRLMTAISMECVHRLCNLQEVARKMELGACINTEQLGKIHFLKTKEQHFFVVDDQMGHQMLAKAEEAAQGACAFFGWLLETNATPELHNILFDFVKQKQNEYRILQDCREQQNQGLY